MRTLFAIIGIVTVVYFLIRGLTARRNTGDPMISDNLIRQSAQGIMAALDTLSGKSLESAKAELDAYGIDYKWEPWGRIIWQMDDIPGITFEKDKTNVAAYSTGDSSSGLYVSVQSIVDNERVISDTSKSKISAKLEQPASNYERLLYARLLEMGAEVVKKD